MSTLCIAIGNPLRGDDNLAHVGQDSGLCNMLHVIQLTPELAAEFSGYDEVIFVDADISATQIQTDPVGETYSLTAPLSHHVSPAVLVALARKLYGWEGSAFVRRIPAADFSPA